MSAPPARAAAGGRPAPGWPVRRLGCSIPLPRPSAFLSFLSPGLRGEPVLLPAGAGLRSAALDRDRSTVHVLSPLRPAGHVRPVWALSGPVSRTQQPSTAHSRLGVGHQGAHAVRWRRLPVTDVSRGHAWWKGPGAPWSHSVRARIQSLRSPPS